MAKRKRNRRSSLLSGARAYLSGPMDFVADRATEKKYGWRNRVGQFLRHYGVTVFDPWNKPQVLGLHEYGREGEQTDPAKKDWTFQDTHAGARSRAKCSGHFWETMHIDLRMVDTSDFIIAYCPTNIYSVGTPHEIIICRQQRKPVLFVSPPVVFPTYDKLEEHLLGDKKGTDLLKKLRDEIPIKKNPDGIPSLWYMPLVGGENFFDGFGFAKYRKKFGWKKIPLDDKEGARKLRRPLLPFIEKVNEELPPKWDNRLKKMVRNDDWLLWDLRMKKGGAELAAIYTAEGKV
ncbi:MAG: hypothetical protein JSW49_00830 [candidate division WOR-3 bacterium]|nr:MAG: hypothetical protein JSW49_00830 [candidate division WOR-3 bacterium]